MKRMRGEANLGAVVGIGALAVLAGFAIWGIGWCMGSSNPETPAGYVGYVTQGAVFGKTEFYGLQTGPTSPGKTWMLNAVNVSITPYTYSEEFSGGESVLSKDNLKVQFRTHIVFRINPDKVKDFVEHYSTLYSHPDDKQSDKVVADAYNNFLKEPFRTFSRTEIQKYNGLDIKDNISQIGEAIQVQVLEKVKGTPFDVMSVVVGNIQYPTEVADAVAKKLAVTQDLERASTEILIEQKKAERRVAEAQGIADSMKIINLQLSTAYLQHEAIEAQKAMVNSPNHTVIYIPVGPMGVPIVGNMDLMNGAKKDTSKPAEEGK